MPNLTIIGMRGAGKSNVARRLSVFTKRPVFATDTMVEYEAGGTPVGDLVSVGGWPAFRAREHAALVRIVKMSDIIIDAGGGLVVRLDEDGNERFNEDNVGLLRASGPVFWLRGDVARLVAKVEAKADRPALTDPAAILALMHRRQAFYEQAATNVIDIDGKRREAVALEILDALGMRPAGSP